MKNKKKLIIIILIIILIILITFLIFKYHQKKLKLQELEKIQKAKIVIKLKDNLEIPVFAKTKVSDFIDEINGNIIDDYKLDTTKLGLQEIKFEYINEENIKIPYTFNINIIDNVPPVIWLNNTYTVNVNYRGNLTDDIMCGDNYDDKPDCQIIGEYNTSEVGQYNLIFEATDSSQNKTTKNFVLNVIKPGSTNNNQTKRTNFTDVINEYKKANTKIGIDVSGWQGEIDYEKVKAAGVEFVFIKVGGTKGINGDYYVDSKFIRNIEGFNSVGIPVGIYFYSYASNKTAAINDAKWVIEQIKDYNVTLPVVYDWENWSFYNEFNNSFYNLSNNAASFLNEITKNGYQAALYSSKSYLENIWFDIGYPTWLAHYTSKTNYQGSYSYWQMCSNGKIDGIEGNVDIDIMYLD